MEFDDQAEGERRRAAERVAGCAAELAEARKAVRTVLARAERAEREAAALRDQMARLTATLRGGSTGPAGRRANASRRDAGGRVVRICLPSAMAGGVNFPRSRYGKSQAIGLCSGVKLFRVPRTGLFVERRTRDEHCPPHVHVENEAVPWEARLAFSFIDNAARLMDVDPIEDAPSTRTIDRIKAAIGGNLAKCRMEWWAKVGTCCIDNRWVRVSEGAPVTVLVRREAAAVQIARAIYDPQVEQMTLVVKDGTSLTMNAGAGVEQWVP